jgi:hypothetical protein
MAANSHTGCDAAQGLCSCRQYGFGQYRFLAVQVSGSTVCII